MAVFSILRKQYPRGVLPLFPCKPLTTTQRSIVMAKKRKAAKKTAKKKAKKAAKKK
jgi:hypothetical protein